LLNLLVTYFHFEQKNPLKIKKNADVLCFRRQGDTSNMSLAQDGLKTKIKAYWAQISVTLDHPLVLLANELPWEGLAEIVTEDLKKTTAKGFWRVGRKLYLRVHLAIFILQARTKKTDREIVQEIQDNAVYQAFCGASVVPRWTCPHATKVEEFRSRLSPETKMKINEAVVLLAVNGGYADPSQLDIDSTVQEANISYPTDARLILKLAEKCKKIRDALRLDIPFDLKKIRSLSLKYFFRSKKCSEEESTNLLSDYYEAVKEMTLPIIKRAEERVVSGALKVKWNLKLYLKQVGIYGRQYLRTVGHYVKTHKAVKGKMLAFHAREVACITKGKVSKKREFGRVFQIGRIGGNFLIALCTGVQMSDKKAIEPMLQKHAELFGKEKLKSFGSDKGYYKAGNIKKAIKAGVDEIGIQAPGNLKNSVNPTERDVQEKIRCRRAGIEPLIGHAKRFGLAKSEMKNDQSTHGSGFKSIMGFNLSQLERNLKQKSLKMTG
jgi:IS5 family transposase